MTNRSGASANQPPPLEDYNLFDGDPALREALVREGGGWIEGEASAFGGRLGTAEMLRLGALANRHAPELHTHDRFGERADRVEFHPAWHELMRLGVERGVHSLAWTTDRSGAQVARAALMMLRHQLDEGTSCPLTMTFAVIPSLRLQPELAQEWQDLVLSRNYDPRFVPAGEKRGALFGMAMTERQGGSDVRVNTSRAEPLGAGGPGGEYAITGEKWFCSAPMCDAFLVLAQAPGGLSCFLLPRWRPDGTRNAFRLRRLKDKLGNRSNASSEVEFVRAWARLIGDEGRGVANILEMVRHTRLDCALGSAATLRRAVAEATHHAHHRLAFGRELDEQPLMRGVLADLCLESEAATALAMRLARGFDEAVEDEAQRLFLRVATPVAKYWVTKRAILGVAEALECLGGNGYVEESPLPRLYRDSPVNSIWEGSGNVQCLDVLRAVNKEPRALEAFLAEVEAASGENRHFDRWLATLRDAASGSGFDEGGARDLVERLALALQASLMIRHLPSEVADSFCEARLARRGALFGVLPDARGAATLLERARPHLAGRAG